MDFLHILLHALKETAVLLPFLYLTYLFLEWVEHKGANKMERWLKAGGRVSPLLGAGLGLIPQCGFSASSAGLYAGRVISMGTLVAVFLSTSDEMLPVMIAGKIEPKTILLVLAVKFAVAAVAGYLVDWLYRPAASDSHSIQDMCDHEHCHCEKGIILSAFCHTLQISGFILLVNFLLGIVLGLVGDEKLAGFIANSGIFAYVVSAFVGLIPNCASSVMLTELYTVGMIRPGMLLAGLLPGAGVGSFVLLRTNRPMRQSILLLLLLLAIGIGVGGLTDLIMGLFA